MSATTTDDPSGGSADAAPNIDAAPHPTPEEERHVASAGGSPKPSSKKHAPPPPPQERNLREDERFDYVGPTNVPEVKKPAEGPGAKVVLNVPEGAKEAGEEGVKKARERRRTRTVRVARADVEKVQLFDEQAKRAEAAAASNDPSFEGRNRGVHPIPKFVPAPGAGGGRALEPAEGKPSRPPPALAASAAVGEEPRGSRGWIIGVLSVVAVGAAAALVITTQTGGTQSSGANAADREGTADQERPTKTAEDAAPAVTDETASADADDADADDADADDADADDAGADDAGADDEAIADAAGTETGDAVAPTAPVVTPPVAPPPVAAPPKAPPKAPPPPWKPPPTSGGDIPQSI